MKKPLLALLLTATSFAATAGDGILQLTADRGGWSIFVNGKKKAVTPDNEGQSLKILLPEGDYTIEAVKDNKYQWQEFRESKQIFIGSDVVQPLHLKLSDAKLKLKPSTIEHNRQQMAEQGWVDNGDGTATNSKTKLTWKRCYEGQTWTGSSCTGEPKGYTWDEAKKLKSNFAGKTDWRLPTIDELHTIVYCTDGRRPIKRDKYGNTVKINGEDGDGKCLGESYQSPTGNLAIFPSLKSYRMNRDNNYYPHLVWSAVAYDFVADYAWIVNFDNGSDGRVNKDSGVAVLLVRSQ